MLNFSDKLMLAIGNRSVKNWAEGVGVPVQTVHEWIKHNRMPRGSNLNIIIKSTGKPKEWWLDGLIDEPIKQLNQDVAPYNLKLPASQAIYKAAREVADVDTTLLEEVVLVVHQYYARGDVAATPERMAKHVAATYKYAAAKGTATSDELDQFLKLIV